MEKVFCVTCLIFFCLFLKDIVSCSTLYENQIDGEDKVVAASSRIVGGYNTTIQDVPYQVYLHLQKGLAYLQCGGSIISERYVLTAAHCLIGITRIFVRTGSSIIDSGGILYNTTKYRHHPFYNPANSNFDIGLINIPDGMTLDGENVRAVQLPSAGATIKPGTNILVTGWGTTSENGQVSESLMGVELPTISSDECRKSYPTLTSRQFCAGVSEGGMDSCQGDSGGPAVATDSGLQLGIVSFGRGCARSGYPGVYTNIARVRWWIKIFSGV